MANIVYSRLSEDPGRTDTSPQCSLDIHWSRTPLHNQEATIFVNTYSDPGPHPGQGMRILFIAEPVVVHPIQYRRDVWERYDAVISCNPLLSAESDRFHYLPVISYGYPFPSGHGKSGDPFSQKQLESRAHALCQICGMKQSLLSQQLYQKRASLARWFHENSSMPCDVFGMPPMNLPNYRGAVESKRDTFSRYRYALCLENCYHPRWSRGYLTEKIFDCFYASTVPIYYGCSNVEDYIPPDCFIDYRNLGSPEDLHQFLESLSLQDYLDYVERIWAFLRTDPPSSTHHAHRLYELISRIVTENHAATRSERSAWPTDYIESGVSIRDRMAFAASCLVLRNPALLRTLLGVTSRIAAATTRNPR